jgi:hypothetical protein
LNENLSTERITRKAKQAYVHLQETIKQAINTYQETLTDLGYIEIKGKVMHGEPGHWEAYVHPDYLNVAKTNLIEDYGGGFWMPDKKAMEKERPIPEGVMLPLVTTKVSRVPDGFELT